MPVKRSEAIVLRTYPLNEADVLVTLFTRAEGKLRGVAKSAKRSRKRFGGALEPCTRVMAYYEDHERRELARIDSCEVLESPLTSMVDYGRAIALAHVAELLDELMPDREANDAIFRLSAAVLENMPAGSIWMPVTYFELWSARLTGLLPDLSECIVCGRTLNGDRSWYHVLADGLMCADDRRLASSEMSIESRSLATEMFRSPVTKFRDVPWPRERAADLRKFLVQTIERHLERKLVTATMLEKL